MSLSKFYAKWSKEDNEYIKKNYLTSTNQEIGVHLGRTADSVRKQLNSLKLKRPNKSESISVKCDFFYLKKQGEKEKKAILKIRKKATKTKNKKDKEIHWSSKNIKKLESLKPVEQKSKKPVFINNKTTIFVDWDTSEEAIEKIRQKYTPQL